MKILKEISKKSVLVLGFGREGISTYKFLRRHFPLKKIGLADIKPLSQFDNETVSLLENDNRLTFHFGSSYLQALANYQIVIKSPGITHQLAEIQTAKNKGVRFISQTTLFLELCSCNVIGVTGTKGKSTTASLIYHILQVAKKPVVLLGNIGKPPLDYYEGGTKNINYVFEMSSHQLFDATQSPHVAVFLNIFPEHLDYYSNYTEYLRAKANITHFQKPSDVFISNCDFREISKIARKTRARKYEFSLKKEMNRGCFLRGHYIYFSDAKKETMVVDSRKITLQGRHNLYNVMAAILAGHISGVSFDDIAKAIYSFRPLEGRLETVGSINRVKFINDTLATIPQATLGAIEAVGTASLTLILGGFDRGVSLAILGRELSTKPNILNIILIGQTASKLKKVLVNYKFRGKIVDLGRSTMTRIVSKALEITPSGGTVLLSPAATSFDMYKDYKDRGDQFAGAVAKLQH